MKGKMIEREKWPRLRGMRRPTDPEWVGQGSQIRINN